jgi:thiamine pyrophosphate-dependent acetolactate synthase large subunit-like protein
LIHDIQRGTTAVKNELHGGEAILQAFRDLKIDYIMSSPGSEWGPVWEALARQEVERNDGPIYLSCQHETLAVDLAIGYTMITGRMQAVMLHAGVGPLQGANGIHGASISETPMIIVSGESLTYGERADFNPGAQWMGSLSIPGSPRRLVEPLVKWSLQVPSAETLYESMLRTGQMAQRTPKGPTYLTVPIENMTQQWTPPERPRNIPPAPKTRAAAGDIDEVAKLLVAAENPVIITDAIGRDPDGMAALVAFAELLGIPVIEGGAANFANFPNDHGLHHGYSIDPYLDEADLMIWVRCRMPWYPPSKFPAKATIVSIDENPFKEYMVYQNHKADLFLEGDAVSSLRMLADAVTAIGFDKARVAQRLERGQEFHDRLRDDATTAEVEARRTSPIDPITLFETVGEVLPDDAIFVDETITHTGLLKRHLRWNDPQKYFRAPSGLGQGLGVSLGIKLAAPERPVVAIIGDGSFLYNPVIQSLCLSRDAKLPILILVMNNGKYQAMESDHRTYYPDGFAARNDLFYGAPLNGPEYSELGAPFGFHGRRVDDPAELADALRESMEAVQGGTTSILNVVLSR